MQRFLTILASLVLALGLHAQLVPLEGVSLTGTTNQLTSGTFTIKSGSTWTLEAGSTASVNVSLTLLDNLRQTFNPGATVSGLNVGAHAGDPSTPVDGDVWYNSSLGALRARINGATVSLGAGGGGGGGDLLASNNLSELTASSATARANLGLTIGTHVQAYSANLVTYAGIAPSANVQTLLGAANYAAFIASLGVPATTRTISTQHSLTGGGDLSVNRTLNLVNDTASPGANKTYGTDGSGVRGWKDDPAGGTFVDPSRTIVASTGSTEAVDAGAVRAADLTLDASTVTLSVSNVPSAKAVSVRWVLRQDATGGRAVTWFSGITWHAATTPTLQADPGGIDVIETTTYDGGTTWLGRTLMSVAGTPGSGFTTLDAFTRANGSGLTTATGGGTWTEAGNQFRIVSNHAQPSTTTGDHRALLATGETDSHVIRCSITTSPTATRTSGGIIVRAIDDANLWYVHIARDGFDTGGVVKLFKRVSGSWDGTPYSSGGATATYAMGTSQTMVFDVTVTATQISVVRDGGSPLWTYTLTSPEQSGFGLSTANKCGIRSDVGATADDGGTIFDDLQVDPTP